MRVLILGGAGFIGSNLVRRCLQDASNRVRVVDSLDPRLHSTIDTLAEVLSRIEFIQGDIRDANLMEHLVGDCDVIFNCAAQTSHPLGQSNALFDAEVNCLGNLTLLEAMRVRDPERRIVVVYTSSSTVVGPTGGVIVDETHAERPLDIYSANKGVAEKYYRIYHTAHDLKTVVLRFANVYGPYGKGSPGFGFVNYFIHQAWHDADITVYGSGAQRRNVLYAEDAVEILYRSAFEPQLIGTIHFAVHHEHLSVLEIAHRVVAVFGRGHVVNIDWPEDRRRIEIGDAVISNARLLALTDWRPRYSFDDGLVRTRAVLERASAGGWSFSPSR